MIGGLLSSEEGTRGARLPRFGPFGTFRARLGGEVASLAVRGSVWVLVGVGASKAVRGLTTLILARVFLGPNEFGLFAIVTAFLSGVGMLADLGITTSVIRHPRGDGPLFLDTAFLIQAGRGVLVSGAAIALAYPFAGFYHQPELLWLVIVSVLEVTVRGFTGVSVWTLSRRVQTRELAFLTLYGDVAGLVVALAWAALSPTVWALVAGRLATAVTYVVASHLKAGMAVEFRWDSGAARELLSFSAGLLASSATYFFVTEGQRLVLAKFTTVAELGCFALAMSLSTLPDQFIGTVVEKVFFPMISRTAAGSVDRAAEHFKEVRPIILVLCCCMVVGFIGFSTMIAHLVLGPRYEAVGWMLPWLGVRAAFMLFACVASYMLFALGFSRYAALGNISKLAYLAVGLTVAFHWFGFQQAIWVIALAPIFGYVPLVLGLKSHLRAVLRTEALCAATLLVVSILASSISCLSRPIWERLHP